MIILPASILDAGFFLGVNSMRDPNCIYKLIITTLFVLCLYAAWSLYGVTREFNQRLADLSASFDDTTARFDAIAFNLATIPPCDVE